MEFCVHSFLENFNIVQDEVINGVGFVLPMLGLLNNIK